MGLEGLSQVIPQYTAALAEAAAEAARIAEDQRLFSEFAQSAGDALSRFAGDAISGFNSVGDAAQRLLAELIQLALQFAIIDPLRRGLEAGSFADAGGIFDFFAQHGGVHQGLGIVGEGGPEIVDFSTPARVYTNDELGQALGGRGGRGITINVSGVQDPTGVRAVIYDTIPEIEEGIRAGLHEDVSRPGNFRDALRGRR